jgi:hypothetical protein
VKFDAGIGLPLGTDSTAYGAGYGILNAQGAEDKPIVAMAEDIKTGKSREYK